MNNIYIYILVMAATIYAIRVLPLTLIRKKIQNRLLKSFLYYVPYVTLAVMTFPAIINSTANVWSGLAAFVVGLILSYRGVSMFAVALSSCGVVFVIETVMKLI